MDRVLFSLPDKEREQLSLLLMEPMIDRCDVEVRKPH